MMQATLYPTLYPLYRIKVEQVSHDLRPRSVVFTIVFVLLLRAFLT